ncbi:MAG TPA: DsbC family protein [Zoogloea sp.]|uniref:DsbC family protein n=1 Tax=Zoogloea sp. TaxID=49181 RepID=UPI002BC0602B|nr:DsbC family protein [Zoogloea sp.]HMV19251.1 DsbC family protein [Rhodocyclaceae bacterium]HMW53538.1 DsbC family protein [Rhodocyclaceae bacterium]HMY49406.1 DsbC family protein [Rhodocyclaceae bacterium]HNB63326.1 DsbC family protein [Rhodocyclaceae bacterium]HNE16902.1 DsbC family protein [Rhodocyclaceae bacterium]
MKSASFRPLALALLLVTGSALANDEAAVRKNLDTFFGGQAVDTVKKTPYGGLYEVVLKSGELVYTDAAVSFLLDGNVIDTKTKQNVTQARMAQLMKIDFATLPLDQAIKQVRGTGKRVIATFEDPNCGYCKRLAKDMVNLKDATIYTFLYPILGPDSLEKSKGIWCAKDRAAAWTDWMTAGKAPAAGSCDTAVLDKNVALGQKMRVSGTPTIFTVDGNRLPGAVPLAQLDKAMDQAATGKR